MAQSDKQNVVKAGVQLKLWNVPVLNKETHYSKLFIQAYSVNCKENRLKINITKYGGKAVLVNHWDITFTCVEGTLPLKY